jgi:hypothetical protein
MRVEVPFPLISFAKDKFHSKQFSRICICFVFIVQFSRFFFVGLLSHIRLLPLARSLTFDYCRLLVFTRAGLSPTARFRTNNCTLFCEKFVTSRLSALLSYHIIFPLSRVFLKKIEIGKYAQITALCFVLFIQITEIF